MVISIDALPPCNGQTGRQTDTPPIPLLRSSVAECNKNAQDKYDKVTGIVCKYIVSAVRKHA